MYKDYLCTDRKEHADLTFWPKCDPCVQEERHKCLIVLSIDINTNLFNDPEVWKPRCKLTPWQLNGKKPMNREDLQNIRPYNGHHVVLSLLSWDYCIKTVAWLHILAKGLHSHSPWNTIQRRVISYLSRWLLLFYIQQYGVTTKI